MCEWWLEKIGKDIVLVVAFSDAVEYYAISPGVWEMLKEDLNIDLIEFHQVEKQFWAELPGENYQWRE